MRTYIEQTHLGVKPKFAMYRIFLLPPSDEIPQRSKALT
jgi:hypothetical protein